MKVAILITVRLGSSRLKRKHLLELNGSPVLQYLIRRIRLEFKSELCDREVVLVIATSDDPENRELELFADDDLSVFYGSSNNIPLRHLQAARHYSAEAIVSVDGDDILC